MTAAEMAGRTCLITGGNSGIGLETARGLVGLGARVILLCRHADRAEKARQDLLREDPNASIDLVLADLASLAQVRRAAAEVRSLSDRLDILVNNAGAYYLRRRLSADGYELTLAVNHLSHFLLTHELLDLLLAAPAARVIAVSSDTHYGGRIHLEDLHLEKSYRGMVAYSQSKLANVLFSSELARRLAAAGSAITSNALHPGFVASNFAKNNGLLARFGMNLARLVAVSPAAGARTPIYLASAAEVAQTTGEYFANCRPKTPSALARDEALAARLWSISEALVVLPPARRLPPADSRRRPDSTQ